MPRQARKQAHLLFTNTSSLDLVQRVSTIKACGKQAFPVGVHFPRLIVYVFLLVILRLTGKRQVGQLAPFDLGAAAGIKQCWSERYERRR